MTPAFSVLLPTVRPQLACRAVESLAHAASGVPYEVVVVADFKEAALGCCAELARLSVRWIERERRGVTDAIETAYQSSRAEFVFVFNDESVMGEGALKALYAEAVRTPDQIVSPVHVPAYVFAYYGKPFVPFPFVHKDVVYKLGGLFDTAYRSFYADPDFSLRAHAAGTQMRVVPDAVLRHDNGWDGPHASNMSAHFSRDQEFFKSRWAHLGEFCDC